MWGRRLHRYSETLGLLRLIISAASLLDIREAATSRILRARFGYRIGLDRRPAMSQPCPHGPQCGSMDAAREQRRGRAAQVVESERPLDRREVIVASRAEAGRKSFDLARTEWAARLKLEPTDGLYLGELLEAPRTIPEIAASLDGCGPQRSEVRPAVKRLVQVRMIELVVPPPAPPAPPWRW